MRLIDADKLENSLKNNLQSFEEMISEHGKGLAHGTRLALMMVKEQPTITPESLQPQWIPVTDKLPDDYDERFYMCVVENHESDPPMYLQYLENAGFGLWNDVFDEHTLGFIDSVFSTNEELGYEKVLAWMPLPEPYTPDGEEVNT